MPSAPPTRREFFRACAHACADGLARAIRRPGVAGAAAVSDPPAAPAMLRPPGAMDNEQFEARCTGCTDCLEACPPGAIRRLGPGFSWRADTPVIVPLESPCQLCEDLPCITACTTGALQPTTRHAVRMGVARVVAESCYRAAGQPCDYCVTRCPIPDTVIADDDDAVPTIRADRCSGCGLCAYLCPPGAIRIDTTHDHRQDITTGAPP